MPDRGRQAKRSPPQWPLNLEELHYKQDVIAKNASPSDPQAFCGRRVPPLGLEGVGGVGRRGCFSILPASVHLGLISRISVRKGKSARGKDNRDYPQTEV